MSHFADWHEFWQMGGYAGPVWSAYGLVFLVLILQFMTAWKKWRALRKNLSHKALRAPHSKIGGNIKPIC